MTGARTPAGRVRGDDGYTLTEMLAVIAIIGLTAAVLTPSLMGQLGRSPTQTESLDALVSAPADEEAWTGPYVRSAKTLKDPWGQVLIYRLEDAGQAFEVVSYGADRKEGGSGVKRDLRRPE